MPTKGLYRNNGDGYFTLTDLLPLTGDKCYEAAFGDLDGRTGRKPTGLSGTPELITRRLQPEDEFLVLASDGLWQLIEPEAAVRLARADLRAHSSAAMAAEKLVQEALHTRRADDNITVLVVLLRAVQPDTSARQRPRLKLMKRGASVPAMLAASTTWPVMAS